MSRSPSTAAFIALRPVENRRAFPRLHVFPAREISYWRTVGRARGGVNSLERVALKLEFPAQPEPALAEERKENGWNRWYAR